VAQGSGFRGLGFGHGTCVGVRIKIVGLWVWGLGCRVHQGDGLGPELLLEICSPGTETKLEEKQRVIRVLDVDQILCRLGFGV